MSFQDFIQSASNTAAGTVSGPVDIVSLLARRFGIPVGDAPVGGSEWMKRKGLTVDVPMGASKLMGETLGLLTPAVVAAKAPQIASSLLKAAENAAAPTKLSRQAGVIDVDALKASNPQVDFFLGQAGDGKPAELARVVVPKSERNSGVGSKFMDDLTKAADADGARLTLSPSSDFGGNKKRLIEFYRRFGFVENKGKNKDFSVFNSMYRDPK